MRALIALIASAALVVLTEVAAFIGVPALSIRSAQTTFVLGVCVLAGGSIVLLVLAMSLPKTGDTRVALAAVSTTALLMTLPCGLVYLPYLGTWAACGDRPVTETTDFESDGSYYLPGDPGYGPSIFSSYVCSEDQVPQGYRRDGTGMGRTEPPVTPAPEPTPTPTSVATRQPCYSGSGKCD